MTARSRRPTNDSARGVHPHWRQLVREYRGDSRLDAHVLYALPKRLLALIKRYVPGLLSKRDQRFERRLRELGASGFILGQPFFSDLLDSGARDAGEFPDAAIANFKLRSELRVTRNIREAFATTRDSVGLTELRDQRARQLESRMTQRLRGYIGWLVSHPVFQVEQMRLMALSHQIIETETDAWRLQQQVDQRPIPRREPQAIKMFRGRLNSFRDRWMLSRLTTWDLPEPLPPAYRVGDTFGRMGVIPTGVLLFAPWPLFADQNLKLREFVEFHQASQDLVHVDEWLNQSPKWGHVRFARMLDVYVYLHLALGGRYGERLRGFVRALDQVFAAYWQSPDASDARIEQGIDSAMKIRRRLQQRLHACEAEVNQLLDALEAGRVPSDDGQLDEQFTAMENKFRSAGRVRRRDNWRI